MASLNTPASKQLLLWHYTQNPGVVSENNNKKYRHISYPANIQKSSDPHYDAFQSQVIAQGNYPKNCRNVAIVNGNDDGSNLFGNGRSFTQYDKNITCWFTLIGIQNFPILLRMRFDVHSNGRADNLVTSLDKPGKMWERTYITGQRNLDNAPGSLRFDVEDLASAIKQGIHDELAAYSFILPVRLRKNPQ